MTTIDIEHLRTWIGREQIITDDLSPFKARALAATFDKDKQPHAGDILPPTWQWLYFLDAPRSDETGIDGHPKVGGFLPPSPLPRRMWAAGDFTVEHPLTIGAAAARHSVVSNVDLKEGKSGTLLFVTVEHETTQHDCVCLTERQNLVYREMPTAQVPLPPGERYPDQPDWRRRMQPTPVLLFRYSALTYNGHRIHYDRDYAIHEEFYPALVVQAPLQATLLHELVSEKLPNARIKRFGFRAQRPIFDIHEMMICGLRDGNKLQLWTETHDGFVAMRADVELEGDL